MSIKTRAHKGSTKARNRGKRWLGGLALAAGTLGASLIWKRRRAMSKKQATKRESRDRSADKWARPGMSVTFRAELMPSCSSAERTFRVRQLLPSGRVVLVGAAGEHTEHEFEPVR